MLEKIPECVVFIARYIFVSPNIGFFNIRPWAHFQRGLFKLNTCHNKVGVFWQRVYTEGGFFEGIQAMKVIMVLFKLKLM